MEIYHMSLLLDESKKHTESLVNIIKFLQEELSSRRI
jgi:hypothetical protein